MPEVCSERHYTPQEIAEMWALSIHTVRRMFTKEPGVLRIGKPLTTRQRGYITIRIPASVLQRVHDRMTSAR
jgi:hypothetical protein